MKRKAADCRKHDLRSLNRRRALTKCSVFVDDAYLVKGMPGRILRKIVYSYLSNGRSEFTNKEIRLDSSLQLPDFKDNLETRLILLRRRIEERCDFLQIVSTGRGRFRFDAKRRLKLESLP